jgi:hypothetical protein
VNSKGNIRRISAIGLSSLALTSVGIGASVESASAAYSPDGSDVRYVQNTLRAQMNARMKRSVNLRGMSLGQMRCRVSPRPKSNLMCEATILSHGEPIGNYLATVNVTEDGWYTTHVDTY